MMRLIFSISALRNVSSPTDCKLGVKWNFLSPINPLEECACSNLHHLTSSKYFPDMWRHIFRTDIPRWLHCVWRLSTTDLGQDIPGVWKEWFVEVCQLLGVKSGGSTKLRYVQLGGSSWLFERILRFSSFYLDHWKILIVHMCGCPLTWGRLQAVMEPRQVFSRSPVRTFFLENVFHHYFILSLSPLYHLKFKFRPSAVSFSGEGCHLEE